MKTQLTILLLMFYTICTATNRYVKTTGNDSNNGLTWATAYLTIQKAADVVNAGDTVTVEAGNYGTSVNTYLVGIIRSGTAGNPIVFRSATKYGAVLNGSYNATDSGWGVVFGDVDYITFEDFEIKNCGRMGVYIMPGSSNIIIKGNYIHDIGRRCSDTDYGMVGIDAWDASNISVTKNKFANIGRYQPSENGCSVSTQFYKNHDHALYFDAISTIVVSYNIFYNNERGWSIHSFSDGTSSNVDIINNIFDDQNPWRTGQILLYSDMTSVRIANNIFYNPPLAGSKEGVCIHVSGTTYTYSNVTIFKNLIYNGVALIGPEGDDGNITSGSISGVTKSNNIENTDPLLLNVSANDYSLREGSPAINSGDSFGLTTDFAGNVIVGNPDIGAYEYDSDPAPPQPSGTQTYLTKKGKVVVLNGKMIFENTD